MDRDEFVAQAISGGPAAFKLLSRNDQRNQIITARVAVEAYKHWLNDHGFDLVEKAAVAVIPHEGKVPRNV